MQHRNDNRIMRSIPAFLLAGVVFLATAAEHAWAIPCLSGFVRDRGGAVVADADLDFTVSATGVRIVTPGDNTDDAGFYNVCVLPGVYDVSFAPPPGTRLMGRLLPAVDLTDDAGVELDVVLDAGFVVTGTITGGGAPVFDVDVDVEAAAGGRVYTPDDNSDAAGVYRVVVPGGLHRFRFEPPLGSRYMGVEIDSVDTSTDVTLDVTLTEGFLVGGRISDGTGAGVSGVDVDLRRRDTGAKIYLANNSTDLQGDYVVAMPGGEFELRYVPPRGSGLVAVRLDSVRIDGDATRDLQLDGGVTTVVVVRGPDGARVPDADLDVKDPLTGVKLFTPHDGTDLAGRAEAVLPPGTYDFVIDPPAGSGLARRELPGVVAAADAVLTVDLAESDRVLVTGRVVDGAGQPVAGAVIDAAFSADGTDISVSDDATDAAGVFAVLLPTGELDITVAPPIGSRLLGSTLPRVTVTAAADLGDLALAEGMLLTVRVRDERGAPVAGADLDVFDAAGGGQIPTFYDDADAAGEAVVALPAGEYRLVVTPPPGSGLAAGELAPLSITADLVVEVTLASAAPPGAGILAFGPNPFGAEIRVDYGAAAAGEVRLDVYDLRGRRVRRLRDGAAAPGAATVVWDGRDDAGARVPAGVYFLKFEAAGVVDTRRVARVR